MSDDQAIIIIRDLKKRYAGKNLVLRGIELDIFPGQIIGYIGPNGAGKTTTVKILIGMLSDFKGEVKVFGSANCDLFNYSESAVNAQYNYWGTATIEEIENGPNPKDITTIYDKWDNPDYGMVNYADWLAEQPYSEPDTAFINITNPGDNTECRPKACTIKGIAYASAGIGCIEVSVDDEATWQRIEGASTWEYPWIIPGDGTYYISARLCDPSDNIIAVSQKIVLVADSTLPTTSGTVETN